MAGIEITGPQDVLAGTLSQLDSSTTRQKMVHDQFKGGQPSTAESTDDREALESIDIDIDAFRERVASLRDRFKNYKLNFEISDSADRVVVKVINEETGEILRTIPPSDILNLSSRQDMDRGWLVDEES